MFTFINLDFYRLTPNDPDVLTEIGVMYLKINDSKSAFERLFDVTKLNERYAKALIALGAILQVRKIRMTINRPPNIKFLIIYIKYCCKQIFNWDIWNYYFFFIGSLKTTLTGPSTNTDSLTQPRMTAVHCGVTLACVSLRKEN